MPRATTSIIISLLILTSPISTSPIQKESGVCTVCKELVDGGKNLGSDALGVYLDVSIGTLCYTVMLPTHQKCVQQLDKVKEELKKDIQNGVSSDVACHNALLC